MTLLATAQQSKLKKAISASEMARIEREAYTQGASDHAFMEAAGEGVADFVHTYTKEHNLEWQVTLLCGKGNNGGDAYVAGRHLINLGHTVQALQLAPIESSSALCQEMRTLYQKAGGEVVDCDSEEAISFLEEGVIVDGMLGTGFRGEMRGLLAKGADLANQSSLPIIAIDIPSGINGNTGEGGAFSVEAAGTVMLGLPKRGCFIGTGWDHVGEIHLVDFGLDERLVKEAHTDFWMATIPNIAELLPPIKRSRHKYQAGYVIGVAGSEEMPGAALLASESALKSGAGMMRLFHHFSENPHSVGAIPEILHEPIKGVESIVGHLEKANAIFIGPGLGKDRGAFLAELLPQIEIPCVIDADGLTVLANQEITLPKETLLTPHRGEMIRLLGVKPEEMDSELEWLERCGTFAKEKGAVVVVKGGPTFIFSPNGEAPYLIPFGDPGMATAGSGDVLTGVLAALLAQGLDPLKAALLGTALHGLAGSRCAKRLSSYALVASDITRELPHIFRTLQRTCSRGASAFLRERGLQKS